MFTFKKFKYSILTTALVLFSLVVSTKLPTSESNEALAYDPIAYSQGIANDENNNIAETTAQGNPVPRYRTLLKYDVSLGTDANEVNVVSTTGQGIKLNGVSLSEISNTLVDYANGTKYIRIKIPQSYLDVLGDGATLEVIEGTQFENYYLDNSMFVLKNNKWNRVTKQSFTKIKWNETDYDDYPDKKGVLLEFGSNLSKKQSEIDGGIRSTNFASTVGEHIYLGGAKLSTLPGAFVSYHSQNHLFVYATNMPSYRTLKIEANTIFLDSALPEVNLTYQNATTKWSTDAKTYSDVTYTGITWNDTGYDNPEDRNIYKNKKGLLLNFSANLSTVQSEKDGGIQALNFASCIGDNVYLGGEKITSIPGAFISYHSTNLLFFYADGMSSYRSLRIEAGTKILDASLPEMEFYFKDATTKWTTGTPSFDSVTCTGITWNDEGYDNPEDKNIYKNKKGLLLNFSANLSKIQSEKVGGIQPVNFAFSTGEHIYLGGAKLSSLDGAFVSYHSTNLLFIYCNNMSSYRTLKIESDTRFIDVLLPEVNLNYTLSDKWSSSPISYTPVTFQEIVWNNIGYNFYVDMKGILISFNANLSLFDKEKNAGIQAVNFAFSLGEHIYFGDAKGSSLDGTFISYHSNNLLFIYSPKMTSLGKLTIESSNFLDATLPDLELFFDGTKWVTKIIPVEDRAICQGIANDENNNKLITLSGDKKVYHTLLKYDVNLGDAANTVNVVSSTGVGILLSGVKLSTISGAIIDYAHGGVYLKIQIPQEYQDALSGEITLEVIEGTQFENKLLDNAKFVLRNGQWAVYKDPTGVNFSSILWNNLGRDVYEGKNGVLISYSAALSNVSKEIKGSMKSINLVNDEIGSKIKLDGTALKDITDAEIMYFGSSFLWIYAPNMASYNDLTIESVTLFTSILPETHLSLFDNKWAESFKITHIINGVKKVINYKKKDKVTLNEEYFANLLNSSLASKLVSFKVGDKTYLPGESLTVNTDLEVTATIVGFETTSGAAIKMSDPSNMRFESMIDKETFDYLVSTYGINNVERGTLIVSKSYLGLDTIDSYFGDSSNVPGVDYIKITNNSFVNSQTATEDGFYKYFGTLENITSEDYSNEYLGIGYIKVNNNDKSFIVYGGNDINSHSRSTYEVVKRAYSNYEIGSKPNLALNSFLDGIISLNGNDGELRVDNMVEGYVSPFVINYDSASNEYQISGNKTAKTVFFNGKDITENQNVIVEVNGTPNKIIDYSLNVAGGNSMLKFKLSPVSKASTLVDFLVEMPKDREMKILQLTDTQIIDSSQKRTEERLNPIATEMWAKGTMDKNCFNHMKELVEKENPDLILFTGDIVYGEFDDSGETLIEIINFMESLGIPWAPIFGNHDNESAKGVDWQCEQFENAKNCLFKKGTLTGNGNYSIGLIDDNGKIRRAIYMLDSNGCLTGAKLAADQLAFMENTANAINSAYGEEIPAFACYHIASDDFKTAFQEKYKYGLEDKFNLDKNGVDGDFGQKNEKVSSIGMSIATNLKNANVDGVFIGHDHVNNFSILYDGIRYTYGTKTGIYDYYNQTILGGTLIRLNADGLFKVNQTYLNEKDISSKPALSTKVTVMSDIHHDLNDYGGFYCKKSLTKLRTILGNSTDSRFFINLGDSVNSMEGSFNNYYDVMALMKEFNLNIFNSEESMYEEGNRMMYNLLGNHEAAYAQKSNFKDYAPYVEGIGSAGVFKRDNLLFVAVDALFTRDGSDDPSDIITCKEFSIPDKEITYLKNEVQTQMDNTIEGIVWISHVAIQDIDETSKGKLLSELKGYGLPMTIFEGHTHIENYQELKDEVTGEVYCKVYTLPAVVLYDNYKYYDVIFKDGEVKCIDKHERELQ